LLIIGALFFDFVLNMDVPFGAIYGNFMIQGSVWALLGVVFLTISARGDWKLRRLKNEGEQFKGTIESFNPVYGVRILHYLTLRVDCSYINFEQKKCLVRSRAFLYGNIFNMRNIGGSLRNTAGDHLAMGLSGTDFSVDIYVNRENPRDYAVEIFERNGEPVSADYDFR
jgi:hypothetical protein